MIIGICGKSGSGKTTLAETIKNKKGNTEILDIDRVGHNSLKTGKNELIKTFGINILTDGEIDRKKLNKVVFNSNKEMDKLTDITWKYMQQEINEFLKKNKNKNIILDWQLLPKTEFFNICDIKILLDTPYEIRKKRSMLRDNVSEQEFDLREKASYKYNKEIFDYVIKNDQELKDLINKL